MHKVGFGHFQWHPSAKEQVKNNFINTLHKYEKEDTLETGCVNCSSSKFAQRHLEKNLRMYFFFRDNTTPV